MAERSVILPGQRAPIVDKDGRLDPVWYRFFFDLHERTGGGAEDLVAAASEPVYLSGATLLNAVLSPSNAEVSYRLSTTGKEQQYKGVGVAYSDINDWLRSGAIADYECRLTVNSGSTPTGSATGSWLALSSTRTWTLAETAAVSSKTSNCTIEIRNVITETVQATATVIMTVTKDL